MTYNRPHNALPDEVLEELVRLVLYEGLSQQAASDVTGVPRSTIGYFIRRERYKTWWEQYDKKPHASATMKQPEQRRRHVGGKRFVFTCAQNNTYVHRKFFNSLQNFLNDTGAELMVGTTYYNQNGFQSTSELNRNDGEVWFDPLIREFIQPNPHQVEVTENLLWLAELNILPTAVNPLSGFHNYTKHESGIIPHVKVCLDSLPRHIDDPDRILYTTGAITYPNYIPKKAGQKAEFHHVFGAIYVEIDDDGDFFVRHLQAESDTGCFYDLNKYYTPDGVEDRTGESVTAINWGDLHIEVMDESVAQVSFGLGSRKLEDGVVVYYEEGLDSSILGVLKPEYQFFNDTADFTIRNHHNIRDPHFRFKMHTTKQDSVRQSLEGVAEAMAVMCKDWLTTVVVDSNHDQALVKWLKNEDYRTDPINAMFFLERQLDYYRALENNIDDYHVFGETMKSLNEYLDSKNIVFLHEGQKFRLHNIEFGYHGHNGPNGARGSAKAFTRIGVRVNKGHGHSAKIIEGCYEAGTCSRIPLPYSDGAPTSWNWSHIVTYANGKRTILTLKKDSKGNAKWRA